MHTVLFSALAFAVSPALADDEVEKPDAPSPELPSPTVQTYAGVGSDTAYGTQGVGEFGGSMAFSLAKGVTSVSADPSIGYFVWDNLELSATVGVRHLSIEDTTSNQFALLAEPSVHLPFNDSLFWFGGVGAGVALLDTSNTDLDTGVALAPRTGLQVLVGRSGLVNLGVRYALFFSEVEGTGGGLGSSSVLAFQDTFDVQAGYTVMF
jgi:hypothetical protein